MKRGWPVIDLVAWVIAVPVLVCFALKFLEVISEALRSTSW